jgi:preprotein translocase subunit YajC|tara:strand:+ start:784 stop:999 length:216 start_codon:yes stop_codon:yes gene_type:complete
MIAPQMRKAKKERTFLKDLKSGDRVVMKSGMHGRINHINPKEGTCIIETTAGKLKFNKSMISMDASNELNK